MPRDLRVNVQVDRLPDVRGKAQIGIRVSAVVAGSGGGMPAAAGDEILPWKWRQGGGDWSPHLAASWMIWRASESMAGATFTAVPQASIGPAASIPATFDTAKLRTRLEQEAAQIISAFGLETAVALPDAASAGGEASVITARTVFGLVESLTSLPHPVAAATATFSAFTINDVLPAAGERFVAVPVFDSSNGGSYDFPAVDPVADVQDGKLIGATYALAAAGGSNPVFQSGVVQIRPSLTAVEIAPPPHGSQSLLDLSTMMIGKPADDRSVEDEDWAVTLARRIADAVDPWVRIRSVLDATLNVELARPDLRDALIADLQRQRDPIPDDPLHPILPKRWSRFLRALDLVAWEIVASRVDGSNIAPPPALTILDGLASRAADVRAATSRIGLKYAANAHPALLGNETRGGFASVDYRHVAGLAGLPANPGDLVVASGVLPPTQSIDTDEGLVQFISRHWLDPEQAVIAPFAVGSSRVIAAWLREVSVDLSAFPLPEAPAGLFDFSRIGSSIEPGGEVIIQLNIGLIPPTAKFALTIDFMRPPDRAQDLQVAVSGEADGLGLTIAITAGIQTVTDTLPRAETTLDISVELKRDAAGGPPTARLVVANARVDATAQVFGPPLYLKMSAADQEIPKVTIGSTDSPGSEFRAAFDRAAIPATLHADMSLAFVAPYLPGILAGRVLWDRAQPALAESALPDRLKRSIAALVGEAYDGHPAPADSLYARVLERALAGAGLPASGAAAPNDTEGELLTALLGSIVAAARHEAVLRAQVLVPQPQSGPVTDVSRRLTVDTPLLAFRIDQLQQFGDGEDLWQRLAGLGVLIARSESLTSNPANLEWRSLNVATLHIPESRNGIREPLSNQNAMMVSSGGWPDGSVVDPVAVQVGEIAGVRTALISYENRSLVGEMPSDSGTSTVESSASVVRRFEAFGFPPKQSKHRLPALSFGYAYHVLPYLIGHGGTLPPVLRQAADEPLLGKFFGRPSITLDPGVTNASRRSALYRRTRAVAAPRLVGRRRRGIPEGVVPLASELPIRPSLVTIGGNELQGRFFLDREYRYGTIDMPAGAADKVGLCIDIGRIEWSGGAGILTITLSGRQPDGTPDSRSISLQQPASGSALRIKFHEQKVVVGTAPGDTYWAEDEFAFAYNTDNTGKPGFSAWQAIWINLVADKPCDIEPPAVTPLVDDQAVGKPRLAPESSHHTRDITVLDWQGTGSKLQLAFRRPSLDFENYACWVNPPLFDNFPADTRLAVTRALNTAHRTATTSDAANLDRTIDDPGVTQICAELVRIFPKRASFSMKVIGASWSGLQEKLGFDQDGRLKELPRVLDVAVDANAAEGLTKATATLHSGCIYELRIFGAVPRKQADLSQFDREQRLSPAVRATMRQSPIDPDMLLGAPLVYTIEVATDVLPQIAGRNDVLSIDWRRPPDGAEVGLVRLADAFVFPAGEFGLPDRDQPYPRIRYCHLASLYSQRWSWRGRPQNDLWQRSALSNVFAPAFSDRSNTDVGDIIERRIERAHAYGGRAQRPNPTRPVPAAATNVPRLFDKSLDWPGGVNLWRFAVRIVSRYAAMRPGGRLAVSSQKHDNGSTVWHQKILLDRPDERDVKRPGLALVLPLTEPIMEPGTVPPLLGLFNETLYSGFHAADGVEVAIETSRHPFTRKNRKERLAKIDEELKTATDPQTIEQLLAERAILAANIASGSDSEPVDSLKYWQEWGPDPIRTGAAADGSNLPLRLDGPIGYTFDIGAEAGRFDHAGYLITPLKPELPPWSLVKLRFRRHEMPEGIDPATAVLGDGPVRIGAGTTPCAPRPLLPGAGAKRLWVANNRALMKANNIDLQNAETNGVFPVRHEGLTVDLDKAVETQGGPSRIVIAFHGDPDPAQNPPPPQDFVEITCKVTAGVDDARRIDLDFATNLGPAGSWSRTIPADGSLSLRLVISARDKPETGDTYQPAGDIAVRGRVMLGNDNNRNLSPDEDRWLAIACLPLTSKYTIKIIDPIEVEISSQLLAPVSVAPIRLSGFTPSIWCQFAEAMSTFTATFHNDPAAKKQVVAGQLLATIATGTTTLAIREKNNVLDSLLPVGQTEIDSQLEELLVVVVTRYVRDAFDRIRERPVAVKLWDAASVSLDLSRPDWPLTKDGNPMTLAPAAFGDNLGRVRFLRILRAKSLERGGFIERDAIFPMDFFNVDMLGTSVEMNPPDAKGMVLGTSMPIEWTRS